MAITIDFLSNVRDLLRGTDDAEEAFEGVADSLDDLARESQRAGDKLGDNIRDGAKDAEKGVDRLERSFKELADTSKREAKGAGDQIGRNYKKGTDDARDGLKDFKEEANSTAKESAASFDGSADSIVDMFQEVAANAFAGFGPAGAAAGLAAAVGIGLISSALQAGSEDSEAMREKVGELATELIETGDVGKLSLEYVIDKIKELATETDPAKNSLDDLREIARKTGVPFDRLAGLYADNSDALDEYIGGVREQIKAMEGAGRGLGDFNAFMEKSADSEKYTGLVLIARKYDSIKKSTEEAAAEEAAWLALGGPEFERKAQLVGTVNDAYDDAAGSVQDYINKETGLFDTAAYIAAMQEKQQALIDYQDTLATSPLSDSAKSFLDSQGAEAAATFLAGYKAATPEQQDELGRIWTEAGKTSSGSYSTALAAGIPKTMEGPLVTPRIGDVDLSEIQRQISNHRFVARVATKFDRVGSPVL
ncbi:hypothetical protein EV379_0911 [Microterricola gilva]|uniref:Uncharacterized protein n=1 Tax=Microterricola gilva TaxID=393267 RepID=A0A4Q8AJR2_9MICO|nr:hypothetical protein [Microterricola gilva]RZU64608.1 hypothetical protein EV379_0911 [Microterricola gilva]